MALFQDYKVADGDEILDRWFADIDAALARRKALVGAIPGYAAPAAVASGDPFTAAMINARRDAAEKLITSGRFHNPATGDPWGMLTECFAWVRENAPGAGAYFVDTGGGIYEWTNVPAGYTDPAGGAGPAGAADLPAGHEPYGRWWNELYAVVHHALRWDGLTPAPIQDGAGVWNVTLVFKVDEASSGDAVSAWAANVSSKTGESLESSGPRTGAGTTFFYKKSGASYLIEEDDGTADSVARLYQTWDVPAYDHSVVGARFAVNLTSFYEDPSGDGAPLNDWTAYVKIATTDPRPYSTGAAGDSDYPGDDLIAGGLAVAGYRWAERLVVTADETRVATGETNYTQARGFEIEPTALPGDAGWTATYRQWGGVIAPVRLMLEIDFDE